MNKIHRLFVYGSLRSGFRNPAYEYISKYFTLVGEAKVKGKMYDMGSYPVAVPSDDADSYIVGELYDLKDQGNFSWAIEQLDEYEGLNPEDGELPSYKREVSTIYLGNQTTEAWVYWFIGNTEGYPVIPSGDIMEFVQHKSRL